jgi:serine protease Do
MKKIITLSAAALLIVAAVFTLVQAKSSGAWLGVYTQEVDRDLSEAFGLAIDRGAIINEVVEDSPAEKAGLKEDDIIIAVNGQKVFDSEDLQDFIYDAQPGDKVTINLMRDDQKMDVTAELEKRPRRMRDRDRWFSWDWDAPTPPRPPKAPKVPDIGQYVFYGDEYGYIGVSLTDLSEDAAMALGAQRAGVLINEVVEDSPAEKAGLKPGDIIVAVDGEKVLDARDVQELVRDHDEGDIARVDVIRNREKSTIEVTVELADKSYRFGRHGVIRIPDLPDLDIYAPRMKGLYRSLDRDDLRFDTEEFREDMKELRRDLEEMQEELQGIKDKLD